MCYTLTVILAYCMFLFCYGNIFSEIFSRIMSYGQQQPEVLEDFSFCTISSPFSLSVRDLLVHSEKISSDYNLKISLSQTNTQ